jgi:hypothetical protein
MMFKMTETLDESIVVPGTIEIKEEAPYLKGEQHPLVSKDSNASSSQPPTTKEQVLVSEPSKESPVTEPSKESPRKGHEDKEWQRPPWPLLPSPKSPEEGSCKKHRDEAKRREIVRYQPSPTNGVSRFLLAQIYLIF